VGNQLGGFAPDVFLPVNLTYKYSKDADMVTIPLIAPGKEPISTLKIDSNDSRTLVLTIEEGAFPLNIRLSFVTKNQQEDIPFALEEGMETEIAEYSVEKKENVKVPKGIPVAKSYIVLTFRISRLENFFNAVPLLHNA
jgi:hypothetical protein